MKINKSVVDRDPSKIALVGEIVNTGSSPTPEKDAVLTLPDPVGAKIDATAFLIPSAERIYIGITHLLRWVRFQSNRMSTVSEEELFRLAQEELCVLGLEDQQITGPMHLLIKFRLLGPNFDYELVKERNKWRSLVILLGIWLTDHHENNLLPSDDREVVRLVREEKVFQNVTPRTLLAIVCTWRHISAFLGLIHDNPTRKTGLTLNPYVNQRTNSMPTLLTETGDEIRKAKKFKSMEDCFGADPRIEGN